MPKVSVVIPVYNIIDYLPRAVSSALAQTERDVEIILVDDGSTDGSGALCDELALTDGRIRVIHKENGGLSSARNAGVAAAAGEYVLLLDGDDRLHPRAAERTLAVMEESGADFVQFRYREVADTVAGEKALLLPEQSCTGYRWAEGSAALFTNLYRLGGEGASACTKLFRRELLERVPFENTRHEDEQWCTVAFQQPLAAAYIDDVLYDYVMRPGSIIRGGYSPSRLDVFRVIEQRLDALKELDLAELQETEYRKLFLAVLTNYRDAVNAGDKASAAAVKEVFSRHREKIGARTGLRGKFAALFRLMCLRFEAAELYRLYWKFRR